VIRAAQGLGKVIAPPVLPVVLGSSPRTTACCKPPGPGDLLPRQAARQIAAPHRGSRESPGSAANTWINRLETRLRPDLWRHGGCLRCLGRQQACRCGKSGGRWRQCWRRLVLPEANGSDAPVTFRGDRKAPRRRQAAQHGRHPRPLERHGGGRRGLTQQRWGCRRRRAPG
jgi:hypothetical protein